MEPKLRNVSHEDLQLFYEVYGTGNTVILCFHGNGRSAEDFRFLEKKSRKIISVHLFLHGHSIFNPSRIDKDLITKEHVEKLLEKIFIKEKVQDFHWVAYSQGGRFTLSVFPTFAKRVKSMFLIAPDGLNDKNFYSWSQRQWWTRKLFKRWVKKPEELMSISRTLEKGKIIHPKILSFLDYYTSDQEKLEIAFKSWSAFRNLRPSMEEIKSAIDKNAVNFNLIIGEQDQIITLKSASLFLNKLNKPEALKTIPYGHDIFKPHIEKELLALMTFEAFD
ncbi:alpha/beta fold hydrolase [Brumimicrobium mesophilum]|uniref:alpha/beta fold hydrolase n=1 Tax=Brumimicrobium mesophilum TaxID=392717 RepID=UPI001F39B04A|nr:alpha/beta hydrolase [Brumimicrobium mesophilum]